MLVYKFYKRSYPSRHLELVVSVVQTHKFSPELTLSLESITKHLVFGPLFLPVPNSFRGMTFNQTCTPGCGLSLCYSTHSV
jgi:hypothetical protein